MLSPVFFRPRPLGMTIGIGAARGFGVSPSYDSINNGDAYVGVAMCWPGIWYVEAVGGGGGGGGAYLDGYGGSGEAGKTGPLYTGTITAGAAQITAKVGRGGAAGVSQASTASGQNGNGNGGGASSVATISTPWSDGGRAWNVGAGTYTRTPTASQWPGGTFGQGGIGALGGPGGTAYSGQGGAVRLTLKG